MCMNRTSDWNVMTVWISLELLFFNFEHLHISCASIAHPCQKWWPSELDQSFRVHLRASLYIMCLKRTSEWKVMVVWIGPEFPCSISSVSIYCGPESDIRVKCYDQLSFPKTFFIKFRASRYIIGLRSTSMLKVMAVWIGPELPCSISSVSIYYLAESYAHVKCSDHWNFSRFFVIQFRMTWYIMALNRTPMSKFIVV